MDKMAKWLIGIAIGVALTFIIELSIGGFALYIHKAVGEVREQQRANTTLLQSFEKRMEDMKDVQRQLRENDLHSIEGQLGAVNKRLESMEKDIKDLLQGKKGR